MASTVISFNCEPTRLKCGARKGSPGSNVHTPHTEWARQWPASHDMREGWQREGYVESYWGYVGKKAGVWIDIKECVTWWIIIIWGQRAVVFCLDLLNESVLHLAAENRNIIFLLLFQSSLSLLSPHVVSLFSPSYLPQVFRYLPPGFCWWCWEVQGALLSSCQGLCGPRGAPAEGPGQFYCPDAFQSMKDIAGSEGGVLGKGAKTGGDQSLSWGSRVCVCDCREHRLPPLSSRLVPSCPVPWGAAGQASAPAWNPHPRARRLSPPSPRFYRNTACATHTGVQLHSFLKKERDVKLYRTLHRRNLNLKSNQSGLMQMWSRLNVQTVFAVLFVTLKGKLHWFYTWKSV